MSTGKRKHLPVSVRQRLRNLREKTGEDYQLLLITYAVESNCNKKGDRTNPIPLNFTASKPYCLLPACAYSPARLLQRGRASVF